MSGKNNSGNAAAFEVRCRECRALQFIGRVPWEETSLDRAELAIKCWRRRCRRIIGLKRVNETGADE